jgi:hypothetical protein
MALTTRKPFPGVPVHADRAQQPPPASRGRRFLQDGLRAGQRAGGRAGVNFTNLFLPKKFMDKHYS